jgi:hypothetical protein
VGCFLKKFENRESTLAQQDTSVMAAIAPPDVFVAMLCQTPRGVGWAAIGKILETCGGGDSTVWLGNRGELRCAWMTDVVSEDKPSETSPLYRFANNAAADAVFYDASLFLRKVTMLPRKDGKWLLSAADATAVINDVWAFNLGHFREGHLKDVDGGGVLSGPHPMLSRMMRDAVHAALADDKIKNGSARVDSVARSDFVALMRSKPQFKVKARNDRQLVYSFVNVRSLDSVMGGPGWEAIYHVGDAGINVVTTKRSGSDGRKVVKRPVKVSFLEKQHKRHGLRGYGHVLISFKFEWDQDSNRRLIGI